MSLFKQTISDFKNGFLSLKSLVSELNDNSVSIKTLWRKFERWNNRKAFKRKSQLALLKHLMLLTKSGIPLDNALRALSELEGNQKAERMAAIETANKVGQGEELNLAMAGWFDADICAAFSVNQHHSEAQHNIVEDLIARDEWFRSTLNKTVKSGTNAYLLILSVGAVFATIIYGIEVLPAFTEQLHPDAIPFIVNLVIYSANVLVDFGVLILLIGIIAIAVFVNRLKNSVSKFRLETLDKKWPFNVYRTVTAYKQFSQFLKLVEWEDTPLQASEKIKGYSSPYVRYHMNVISERATEGESNLSDLLDISLLSRATRKQMRLASKSEAYSVTKEIMSQIPVLMQVETKIVLTRLQWIIFISLLGFSVAILLSLALSHLNVYAQLLSTTNTGY